MNRLLVLALLFTSNFGFAHTGGHGPEIKGRGPNNGLLVALVSAKEVDLKQKAKVQAVIEWVKTENSIEFMVLDAETKNILELSGVGFKLIAVPKGAGEKPSVRDLVFKKALTLNGGYRIDVLPKLANLKMIEVILAPQQWSLPLKSEKSVFAINL